MEERRRCKRTKLQSKIVLKQINGEGEEEVGIDVVDVSKSGVGFNCDRVLAIGAVYEAYLTIWTREVLHAILEIIRIEKRKIPYLTVRFLLVCRKWMQCVFPYIRQWKNMGTQTKKSREKPLYAK